MPRSVRTLISTTEPIRPNNDMSSDLRIHLFLDLSSSALRAELIEEHLRSVLEEIGASDIDSAGVSLLLPESMMDTQLPSNWSIGKAQDRVVFASQALNRAAHHQAALLMISGAHVPSAEMLQEMFEALETDPLFGFAVPRLRRPDADRVAPLVSAPWDQSPDFLSVSMLEKLPNYYVWNGSFQRVFLISRQIVTLFHELDHDYETLEGAMSELIDFARQCGFSTIVCNRAICTISDEFSLETDRPSENDLERLRSRFPESELLREQNLLSSKLRFEELLAHSVRTGEVPLRTMLLDLTDLNDQYNGTSEAVIAILKGLSEIKPEWQIDLLIDPKAYAFHEIDRFEGAFRPVSEDLQRNYLAALRPIQPWSLEQIARLHNLSLSVFFYMFDTILHDSGLKPELDLGSVWDFMARHADGIFYCSQFTQERFESRFTVDHRVIQHVAMLPTDHREYMKEESGENGGYAFVVGNALPHKWLAPTLQDLCNAFPQQKFKTLGAVPFSHENVEHIESGFQSTEVVDALYQKADFVIYPSVYEGFGFPLVRSLSLGKTVIARESTLLHEVASRYQGPGRLLAYSSQFELIELVGRTIRQATVEEVVLGGGGEHGGGAITPASMARGMLEKIEQRVADPTSGSWWSRQDQFEKARRLVGAGR